MVKLTIEFSDELYNRLCNLTVAVDASLSHEGKLIGKSPQLPWFAHEPGPTVILACERLIAEAREKLGSEDAAMLDNRHQDYYQVVKRGGSLDRLFDAVIKNEPDDLRDSEGDAP